MLTLISALLCHTPWTAHSLMQNLTITFDFEQTVQLRRIAIKTKNVQTVSAMGDGARILRKALGVFIFFLNS